MKTPKFIDTWLSRYIDGEIEPAQKKVIDEWVASSPELRDDIESQKAVSSHLKSTLSNPRIRSQMEAKLNNTLSTLPQQAAKIKRSWFDRILQTKLNIPNLPRPVVGLAALFVCIVLFAVMNGPITSEKAKQIAQDNQEHIALFQQKPIPLASWFVPWESITRDQGETASGLAGLKDVRPSTDRSQPKSVSQKTYAETTESRGISGPPGVVSNTRDNGSVLEIQQPALRRGLPTSPVIESLQSLGNSSGSTSNSQNFYSALPSNMSRPLSDKEKEQAYVYYMRVYGDRFKSFTQEQKTALDTQEQKTALEEYWQQFGTQYSNGIDNDGDAIRDSGSVLEIPSPLDNSSTSIEESITSNRHPAVTLSADTLLPHVDTVGEAPPIAQAGRDQETTQPTSTSVEDTSQSMEEEDENVTEGRKIIRNARMDLQVQDVLATKDSIEEMVKEIKGIVSNANINQDSQVPSARMTLWVPAEVLEDTIEELNELGKTLNLEIFTNDITEQYFDIASRMRNLIIQEQRLLKLYEREVKKLDEILQVEKEIQRVRTEIEQLQGRIRMWDRQIALSTIEISIQQAPEKKPIAQSEPYTVWSPLKRVWRDAGAVFLYSCSIMTGIAAAVISTMIFFIPWMLGLALAGILGRMGWRRYTG